MSSWTELSRSDWRSEIRLRRRRRRRKYTLLGGLLAAVAVEVGDEEKAKMEKEKAKAIGITSGMEAGTAEKKKRKEERKEITRERRVAMDREDSTGAEKVATGIMAESRKVE